MICYIIKCNIFSFLLPELLGKKWQGKLFDTFFCHLSFSVGFINLTGFASARLYKYCAHCACRGQRIKNNHIKTFIPAAINTKARAIRIQRLENLLASKLLITIDGIDPASRLINIDQSTIPANR